MNLDPFRDWLREEGYREASVRKFATDLQSYLDNPELATKPASHQRAYDYKYAWDMFHEFVEDTGARKLRAEAPPEPPKRRRGRRKKLRQKAAVSIPEGAWKRLRDAVEKDPKPQARVLGVLMDTGLRIGDVLRLSRSTLAGAFRREDGLMQVEIKGGEITQVSVKGAPKAWKRLYRALCDDKKARSVPLLVSSSPSPEPAGAAYKAVQRALDRLAKKVRVDGRVHLHRLRRTVAVRATTNGVPDHIVQRILGHASFQTTQRYTDEQMADRVAKALRQIQVGG